MIAKRTYSLETVSRIWEQFSLPKYLGYLKPFVLNHVSNVENLDIE